jgi:hypothetical protein
MRDCPYQPIQTICSTCSTVSIRDGTTQSGRHGFPDNGGSRGRGAKGLYDGFGG